MKHYRVSIEDTFCRDVEVNATTCEEAMEKAIAKDWHEQDWCDGHEPRVSGVWERDKDGNEAKCEEV